MSGQGGARVPYSGMEVGPILAALPTGAPGRGRIRRIAGRRRLRGRGDRQRRRAGRLRPPRPAGPGLVGRVPRLRARAQHRAGPAADRRPGTGADPVPDACFIRFAAYAEIDRADRSVPGLRAGARPRRRLEAAVDAARRRYAGAERPGSGPWRSSLDRPEFEAGVRTIVDHIEAGDCYQVNLTRRLTCDAPGGPGRARGARWSPATRRRTRRSCAPAPTCSAVDLAVVSASPERFLRVDGRRVETRPIKGTAVVPRAAAREREGPGRERDDRRPRPQRSRTGLRAGLGDGAGAVRARAAPRARPPREHRARIAATRGRLRRACCARRSRRRRSPARRSRACSRRSRTSSRSRAACTAARSAGSTRVTDRADLAVAIRTFTVTPDATQLGVGAGITADSDPAAEWHETELKAARLLTVAGAGASRGRAGVGGAPVRTPMKVWVNGVARRRVAALRISPLDHGLLVGDGVFETLRVYDGVPFAWRRHHERLAALGRTGSGSRCRPRRRCAPRPDAVLAANELREGAAAHHGHRRRVARSAPNGATPRRR